MTHVKLHRKLFIRYALYLLEHSKPNMYKSGVVDAENGGSSISNIRTSTGSFLPSGRMRTCFGFVLALVHGILCFVYNRR